MTERGISEMDFQIYAKLFEQELLYMHFDKDFLNTVIKKGKCIYHCPCANIRSALLNGIL